MNILYITQLLPYPPDSGGRIKTLSTLRALCKKHKITIISFVTNDNEQKQAEKLKKVLLCNEILTVVNPLVVEKNLEQQLWVMFKSLFTLKPYALYKFWSNEMSALVLRITRERRFDCYWFDHLSMTQYCPRSHVVPRVLENHNVEHVLYLRHAQHESKLLWRLFFYLESAKYWLYEKSVAGRFKKILVISNNDRKQASGNSVVYPPAVSGSYFSLKRKPIPNTLLFMGLLTWYPNKQGVLWFIKRVFPIISSRHTNTRLVVVGDKTKRFPVGKNRNIHFTGYVKSVIPYLQNASIFIAPILFGSGVRIKILEAMAAGIPVVSTTIGAEGIQATNNKNICIADTPQEFANSVINLLSNDKVSKTIGSAARNFVRSHHTQRHVDTIIAGVLESIKKP